MSSHCSYRAEIIWRKKAFLLPSWEASRGLGVISSNKTTEDWRSRLVILSCINIWWSDPELNVPIGCVLSSFYYCLEVNGNITLGCVSWGSALQEDDEKPIAPCSKIWMNWMNELLLYCSLRYLWPCWPIKSMVWRLCHDWSYKCLCLPYDIPWSRPLSNQWARISKFASEKFPSWRIINKNPTHCWWGKTILKEIVTFLKWSIRWGTMKLPFLYRGICLLIINQEGPMKPNQLFMAIP